MLCRNIQRLLMEMKLLVIAMMNDTILDCKCVMHMPLRSANISVMVSMLVTIAHFS